MNFVNATSKSHTYQFSIQQLNELADAFGIKYDEKDANWIFDKNSFLPTEIKIKDVFYDHYMMDTYPQDYDDAFKYKTAKKYWVCRALMTIDKNIEGFYLV